MKTTALLLLLTASILGVAPASADPIYWTTWSTNTDGTITTPDTAISVTYAGELSGLSLGYPTWTPTASYADGIVVDNAPPQTGNMIRLLGGLTTIDTITFSPPIVNPVFAIWSLGASGTPATFEFADATPIFVVGGPSAEYGGGAITVSGNTVSGSEANGTVTFLGTYSSISWNNPLFESYYGFTVGVASVAQVCQKKLALMVNSTLDSEAGLYTIQADGSGLTKLLAVPASSRGGGAPRWSPDGQKIAFDAELNGYDEIYVINRDGTGLQQLTFDSATDRDPAWSPDGARIVFSSNRGGLSQQDLFVMDAGGGDVVNLTNSPRSDEYAPAWSPDGAQVVFDRSVTNKPSDLWIMNADGSGQRNLTPHTKAYTDGSGRWLPDGAKLIFTSTRMGNGELFTMNLDGTAVTALTSNTAYNYGATTWSHQDGSLEIAFASHRSGSSGVYTINGNGTHQKTIFLTSASDNVYVDVRR